MVPLVIEERARKENIGGVGERPRTRMDQAGEERSACGGRDAAEGRQAAFGLGLAKLGKLAKFCKFLAGSFSAVSKRIFARKYAFDSIFQALQDLHPFAPLQSQNFRKKSV